MSFFQEIQKATKHGAPILLGSIALVIWGVIHIILVFPLNIYRTIITKVVSPTFAPENGDPVILLGQPMATDFQEKYEKLQKRSTVAAAITLDGIINKHFLEKSIQLRWIEAKNEKTGRLLYPELQQYIVNFMGFMFWRMDKTFDLHEHLHFKELETFSTPSETNLFTQNFLEDLQNKPYNSCKSPWEIFCFTNFKDLSNNSSASDGEMTLIFFRFHHALADGVSALQLFIKGLCQKSLKDINIAPRENTVTIGDSVADSLKLPFKYLHSVGKFCLLWFPERVPWHCTDEMQSGKLFVCVSSPVSVEKIKFVKNRLGCSFLGVLLSCVSVGIMQSFKHLKFHTKSKTIPIGMPVPLPGIIHRLGNNLSGIVIPLPVEDTLDFLERLRATEKELICSKTSKDFAVYTAFLSTVSKLPTPLSRFLFRNPLCCNISPFVGAIEPTKIAGRSMTGLTGAVGPLDGDVGVAISMYSYVDKLHFMVTAEAAVMDKEHLTEVVNTMYNEVNKLYDMSLKLTASNI